MKFHESIGLKPRISFSFYACLDLRSFESHVENQKELHKEQRDPIVQQLQSLVQVFQSASEKLSTSMSGSLLEMMQTQLTSSMKR